MRNAQRHRLGWDVIGRGESPGAARLAFLAALLAASAAASAQSKPATRPALAAEVGAALPTAEAIQAHITRLAQAKGLDEAVRTKATEAYKQALGQLEVIKDWQAKTAAFEAAAKDAPAKLAETRKLLGPAGSQPAATAPAAATLEKAEQLLTRADAELAEARKTLSDLEAEPKRRAERRLAIPKLLAAAKLGLDEIDKQLAALPKDAAPELAAANRALLETQKEAVRCELDAYQKELASYDAERELLTARLDYASRRAAQAEKMQKAIQEMANNKRKEDAERAAREAEAAAMRAARAHPLLHEIAEENASLTTQRTGPQGLATRIPQKTAKLDELKALLTRLQQDFKSLAEKEKLVGKTATFGVLLRKQRAELPDVRQYRHQAQARQDEISDVQLRLIELQERRAALSDIEAGVQRILAKLDPSIQPAQRERIAGAGRELLQARRKNLEDLTKDYDTYFAKLIDLDVNVRAIVAKCQEIGNYINERVLWIRSAPPIGWRDVPHAADAAHWLLGPSSWVEAGQALWADARRNPFSVAAGLVVFAALLGLRRKLIARLAKTGQPRSRGAGEGIASTILAVAITAVLALILPGLLWFVAWRLASSAEATDAAKALAAGSMTVVTVLITVGTLTQICRPRGLAEGHFGWPAGRLLALRRSLWILTVVLAVLGFVVSGMEWQANEAWRNSLGRLALIAALVVLAIFAQRLLRPSGVLLAQTVAKAPTGALYRLRHVWYVLAVAAPVLLAVLAAMGFSYTALHLTGGLAMTFWLAVGLAILNALALRWLAITFRRLAVRRLRARAAGRKEPAAGEAPAGGAPDQDLAAESEVRLATINRQTRQLLRSVVILALVVGTWRIWADSLPALGALRRVELWTHTARTTTQVTAADGSTVQQTLEKELPITLADAGLAVLVLILTVVAARNIPGFLEIAILQRIHADAGVRYATSAILRYTIAVAGVILAFNAIGVGWSSVQWLVAAMTVGLGFGLQEIFANFVSGLIILFERPIRIGDTVTIGETAGTVTRIRIRATTITDWDRKELIVPNKEFVTGRLVNWTLSDRVLRVILRVGVAYGSDTALAEKLLYEEAGKHPLVLDDPKPVVLFSSFGDNSLNFELRVYISGIEHYLRVWHDLNMAIDKAFRQAGITIAFPQRDVHVDTLEPLEIRILPVDQARPRRQGADPTDAG